MLGKDYAVIEPIGFGGMAVVYLVEHQKLQKRFAAKVLSAELAKNFEARARFTQEAHSASQLDHENIVTISDFGVTADQRPFFVMELLRGQTLDQRMAEGAMALEEVVAVAVPVAKALAHSHDEGIVHRDVKPENIFLVQRSQNRFGVKVVDFGIAKTPLDEKLTRLGQTLGSPRYMSPEACRGEEVDHRADVYSFGVLLYQMLCGRLPFEAATLQETMEMQVLTPHPPPRSVNPALSPALAAVLDRALAKSADARYESMEALLVDFEAALPPEANRLLIEVQSGRTSSFRITPFPFPGVESRPSQQGLQPVVAPSQRTLPPPAGRGGRKLVVLGGAIGLVAAAIVVMLLGRDTAPTGPAATASAKPTAAAALAPPTGARTTMPTAGVPGSEPTRPPANPVTVAPAAVPTTFHLAVTSTPPGATVVLAGKRLGVTPLELDLPRASGTQPLVVARAGHERIERELPLDTDTSLELVLPHARMAAKAPKRVAEKKPVVTRDPESKKPALGSAGSNLDIRLSR